MTPHVSLPLRIFWLDDQPTFATSAVRRMADLGAQVELFHHEDALLERLQGGHTPSVFVQDLARPSSLPGRGSLVDPEAGWKLYLQLKRDFPEVPVVICSYDGNLVENRNRARDFNLRLVAKRPFKAADFFNLLQEVVAAQRPLLHLVDGVPAVVTVDFSKVNAALIRHLAARPEDLDNVSWSTFESLVEHLLRELGYDVLRTPLTRDGGVDLWAVQHSALAETIVAIDAKKYGRGMVVGPQPVRAIHGVADLAGANVGMIVTTARFGPAAQRLAAQHRYRIALRDFDGVCDWLSQVGAL